MEANKEIADTVLASLKARYFAILMSENYPKTPEVTNELDKIEKAISSIKEEKKRN